MSSGDALVGACRPEIEKFYALCNNGALEPIALMFSELAGEQMPPDMIMQVLRITEQQKSMAMEQRMLLKCTLDQFISAMRTSFEEGDSIDDTKKLLGRHIARLDNAQKICTELRPKMAEFHTRHNGSVEKIAALFSDMAPEPAKGKPLPKGMINALLRIPNNATTCKLEDLVECFQRNLDENDSVAKTAPYLEKTY